MGAFQSMAPGYPGGTSDVYTTPYPVAVGTKARDGSGNEYVFCDFTSNVYPEGPVIISADFTAAAITTGPVRGAIGIVADLGKSGNTSAPVSPYTSDQGGWVQIYGRAFVMVSIGGGTVVSPSDAANGPTTVQTSVGYKFLIPTSATTPPGALFGTSDNIYSSTQFNPIRGMWVAQDVSLGDVTAVTAVSATHTGNRVAVWLNYPVADYVDITT